MRVQSSLTFSDKSFFFLLLSSLLFTALHIYAVCTQHRRSSARVCILFIRVILDKNDKVCRIPHKQRQGIGIE
jgi:hypothetical protein